jgi:hypothetical protein
MNTQSNYHIKKALKDEQFDNMYKEKFNQEQTEALKEFKDLIYESEKKKKENTPNQ